MKKLSILILVATFAIACNGQSRTNRLYRPCPNPSTPAIVEVEADIDFRGLLGHDKSVRNGFSDIRYTVTIQSPAPEDKVRRCKETIDRKSPVGDTIAQPTKISSRFVFKPS